jgi:glycerol-3-phosphate dehydrogenase (NAD(P)+)
MRCTVVGAGAWGTALANLLAENGHEVLLWAYETDVSESVNTASENRRFLAGVPLHGGLRATSAIDRACAHAEMIVFAAPSHVLRGVAADAARHVPADVPLVVATKGIERERLALMTDVVEQEIAAHPIVALSGPSFALEVANHLPTAIVAASRDQAAALLVQQAFSTSAFRIYTQRDVIGVELGGALKNVMAVATGIADGLQLGFNARAALITRGLAEMTRLGLRLGADPATFAGLAGIGDLVLTCTGSLSRNRSVGLEIGRGASLNEVLQGRETVAEGVTTTESARALAMREGVEMPIVNAVYKVLFERQPARWALVELMTRDLKGEVE